MGAAAPEQGPRWGTLSQERASRFVVAWGFGATEEASAPKAVVQTRARTRDRRGTCWISDGSGSYEKWIRKTYSDPMRRGRPGRPKRELVRGTGLTQLIKTRKNGRIVHVRIRHCFGPEASSAHTVHVERRNGVLRDRLNCLSRRTHGFAKRVRTWDAVVSLSLFEENWMRPHVALRIRKDDLPDGRRYEQRSPAMAVGLATHVWSWCEFLTRSVHQCW